MIPVPLLQPERQATLSRALNIALDKRKQSIAEFPDWEQMRQRAHEIRIGALDRLDENLDNFNRAATANGIRVSYAATAEDACNYVIDVARRLGVSSAVKAKSMVSEEIHLNHALEAAGIRPVETDLGEYIAQLNGQPPFHLTAPIVHLSRQEVGRILADKLGVPYSDDSTQLTLIARDALRREFMNARLGITGANFVVAESGSLVLVTNEGNGRMSTTLPGGASPRVHVAITGIEKVIPTLRDVSHLLRMLARSGSGLRLTAYTTFINGPRSRTGDVEPTGPDEVHLILLDNGRRAMLNDPVLREALCCIRCGACSNVCPVYHRVGGHSYQSVYNGPIGSVWSAGLWNTSAAQTLPFVSSLCGACSEICPVKINIHHALVYQRSLLAGRKAPDDTVVVIPPRDRTGRAGGRLSFETIAWKAWRLGMNVPILYRAACFCGSLVPRVLLRKLARPWTDARELPCLARKTFHDYWRTRGNE